MTMVRPKDRESPAIHQPASLADWTNERCAEEVKGRGVQAKQALEQLVARFEEHLLRLFVRLGSDLQTAEDLTQEVFLKVYTDGLKSYHCNEGPLAPYLMRIARNLWIDRVGRQRPGPASLPADCDRPDNSPAVLESILEGELVGYVHLAIKTIANDAEREAIRLYLFAGWSGAQIAEHLGRPISTVHASLERAREKVRVYLSDKGYSAS